MEINWLFVAIVCLFLVFTLNGYRKGFLRIVVSFIGTVVIIIAVIALMPKVKEFVLENTTIYEATRQKVIHVFLNTIDDNDNEEGNNEAIKSLNMPDIITDLLIENNTIEIIPERSSLLNYSSTSYGS